MLLLLACSTPDSASPADSTPACPTAETRTLASGFADGTEGVSFVDGRLFVTEPDAVVELSPDGTLAPIVSVDHALGLAPTASALYLADPGEFTFDADDTDGTLKRVRLDGTVETLATGMPNPNFVLPARDDVLVSDDTGDTIYAVNAAGEVRVWADGIPSPNGMAWALDGSAVYVVSTFVEEPPLWRIPVDGGAAGTPEEVVRFETGDAPDGLAIDADGGLWVALNLAGSLVRVEPDGTITDRIDGLTTPASLAFGDGDAWDACSLYVTSLYGDTVVQVGAGRRGP